MQPFTYLIGWTTLDRWYYGVRYSKGCHPQDLWTTYFTSSKHVHSFAKENGSPDIIQVRRLFPNRDKALRWEETVLRRMRVANNDRWLNKTNKRCITCDYNDEWKMKLKEAWRSRRNTPVSKQTRLKMSIAKKGKKKPEGFSDKCRKNRLGKPAPNRGMKFKGPKKFWWNDGKKEILSPDRPGEGFTKGRLS